MSYNVHLDREMFNSDIKERFLNSYGNEETKKNYTRVFYNCKPIESMSNEDLCNFTLEQIEEVMYAIAPSTRVAATAALSVIRSYIGWAITNGYRSNNINPLDIINNEWKDQFISDEIMYYSKETIDQVIRDAVNAQDAVIVSLLFEGIYGVRAAEIRNLTKNDIDTENNKLTVKDEDGKTRVVEVSDQCINVLDAAIRQTDYIHSNGNLSEHARISKSRDLIETGFVLKPTRGRNKYLEQMTEQSIYSRLKTLAIAYDLIHLKKAKSVYRSGMIWMGKQILERDGVLEKEQLIEICERFGVGQVFRNNKMELQWHGLKDYVNVDVINKLYNKTTH